VDRNVVQHEKKRSVSAADLHKRAAGAALSLVNPPSPLQLGQGFRLPQLQHGQSDLISVYAGTYTGTYFTTTTTTSSRTTSSTTRQSRTANSPPVRHRAGPAHVSHPAHATATAFHKLGTADFVPFRHGASAVATAVNPARHWQVSHTERPRFVYNRLAMNRDGVSHVSSSAAETYFQVVCRGNERTGNKKEVKIRATHRLFRA